MRKQERDEVHQLRRDRDRQTDREQYILLADIGDGSKDGQTEEVAEDAEDELVDPGIESYFGNHVVAPVEELQQSHGRVRPLGIVSDPAAGDSRHPRLFSDSAPV